MKPTYEQLQHDNIWLEGDVKYWKREAGMRLIVGIVFIFVALYLSYHLNDLTNQNTKLQNQINDYKINYVPVLYYGMNWTTYKGLLIKCDNFCYSFNKNFYGDFQPLNNTCLCKK